MATLTVNPRSHDLLSWPVRMTLPLKFDIFALLLAGFGFSGVASAIDPYPLEYFALPDEIRNVKISPDGERLVSLAIPANDGRTTLEVYDAANLDEAPIRIETDLMEIRTAVWVSDDELIIGLRQKVGGEIDDANGAYYKTRIAKLNVNRKKIEMFDEANAVLENVLPHRSGEIIISLPAGNFSEDDTGLEESFRPRSYYEFSLSKGTIRLLTHGRLSLGNIDFDEDGNPWLARGFDKIDAEYVWYRHCGDNKGWQEFHRLHADSHESFTVYGVDPADADSVLVVAGNGHDKKGLWSYNTSTKAFGELIYRRNDVDVSGVRFHSNRWNNQGTVVGVSYYKDRTRYEYFDDEEASINIELEQLIPAAYRTMVTSSSRDGQSLTIFNDGPNDPGSYYMIKDSALKKIGSKQPLLSPLVLADVEYITYQARDGRDLAAFVTRPKDDPPYPLIVMPHDGPFIQEFVYYDEWAQMLANNGYMVLQPQYRGSLGYGVDFHRAAIEGGGQGGYKMQDDKDDGALYLVEQGLADKGRMAMFGWSYGGYAALIAASGTPQNYQCVMAAAAIIDTEFQVDYYRDQRQGHRRNQHLSLWNDSISPIGEVENVNVPVLLIHGSADQQVPVAQARKYQQLLEKYGKDHRYVELAGAGHFSSALSFEQRLEFHTAIIDYLRDECGGMANIVGASE